MCANLSSKLVFSTLLLAQYGCYCECSWQMSPMLCITCVRYSCVEMCDFVCLIQSTVTMTVRPSAGGCCIGDVHSTNIKFNRWCQCWMARIPTHLQVTVCECVGGGFCIRHLVHDNHFIRNSNPLCFRAFSFTSQCHLYCSFNVLFPLANVAFYRFDSLERISVSDKKKKCTRWENARVNRVKQSTNTASGTVQYIITKRLFRMYL